MSEENKIQEEKFENEKSNPDSYRDENVNEHFPEDSHAPQPQTINYKQETENMEVHKHPHHVTHKKKWAEYLLEFLMLFLAVFLGFLAENIREHQIEKKREKIFMKNMLEDLQSDTAAFQKFADDNKAMFSSIDSLMYLLKSPERQAEAGRIYFLARSLTMRSDLLLTNQRTYDQMRSSGSLRLIHNQKVSDSVSSYYNLLKQITDQNYRIVTRGDQYILTMHHLFDAEILLKIYKERTEPGSPVKLLTEDPAAINELLTRAQYLYGTIYYGQNFGLQSYSRAENLIELIKGEYHLE